MCCDVFMPDGLFGLENNKWLEYWLGFYTGSIMCTSYAAAFLDKMRMHIIVPGQEVKFSRGAECNTLTLFVEKYLVKKAYSS